MTEPRIVVDPSRAYNFKLEIQGVTTGHFTECTGLGVRVGGIKYREGGVSQDVHRLPGPVEYADVTLKYGVTSSSDLWEWFRKSINGKVERRNVSIIMLQPDGASEAQRWNLMSAWPSKWNGPPLDALSQEAAIESLTLVFEGLQRA